MIPKKSLTNVTSLNFYCHYQVQKMLIMTWNFFGGKKKKFQGKKQPRMYFDMEMHD